LDFGPTCHPSFNISIVAIPSNDFHHYKTNITPAASAKAGIAPQATLFAAPVNITVVPVMVPFENWVYVGRVTGVVLELVVVLTGAGLDGVALTETLADAGLVGAAVLVDAIVASDVRASVRL